MTKRTVPGDRGDGSFGHQVAGRPLIELVEILVRRLDRGTRYAIQPPRRTAVAISQSGASKLVLSQHPR